MANSMNLGWNRLDAIHNIPLMSIANTSIVTVPIVAAILSIIRAFGENLIDASGKIQESIHHQASKASLDTAWVTSYIDTYDAFFQMEFANATLPTHLTLIYGSALLIALANIFVSIFIPNNIAEFKTDIEYVESHSSALSAAVKIDNHKPKDDDENDVLKLLVQNYSNKDIKSYAASIQEWHKINNSYWFIRGLCSIFYILGGAGVFVYLFFLLPSRVLDII